MLREKLPNKQLSEKEELKLVKKAIQGNKEAFDELILNYRKDLYKIAVSEFGDRREDVDDVVQETIFAAYIGITKLEKPASFKSWLIKILYNKCYDIFRKDAPVDTISFEEGGCDEYIESGERVESNIEFKSIMNVLTPEERSVLMMKYAYEYNSKEISKLLEMKPGTVRSKASRALEKIEKDLKEELKL